MLDPEVMIVADQMKASNDTMLVKIANGLKNHGTFCANMEAAIKNRGAFLSEYATLKTEVNILLECPFCLPIYDSSSNRSNFLFTMF